MAVKASAGNKITDNVGPLEVTAGDDSSACHESFKAVRTIMATFNTQRPELRQSTIDDDQGERDRGYPREGRFLTITMSFVPASCSFCSLFLRAYAHRNFNGMAVNCVSHDYGGYGDDDHLMTITMNQVVKGFVPVDEFGNLVKNVPRAPEIKLEGMPLTKRESSPSRGDVLF